MISLNPGSLCDVCAEEYGPHNYPHSIPCGEFDYLRSVLEKKFLTFFLVQPLFRHRRTYIVPQLLQQHPSENVSTSYAFLSFLSRAVH